MDNCFRGVGHRFNQSFRGDGVMTIRKSNPVETIVQETFLGRPFLSRRFKRRISNHKIDFRRHFTSVSFRSGWCPSFLAFHDQPGEHAQQLSKEHNQALVSLSSNPALLGSCKSESYTRIGSRSCIRISDLYLSMRLLTSCSK